jgi:ubiquinone/menaquinone biosynthesis C-methylase UbiE
LFKLPKHIKKIYPAQASLLEKAAAELFNDISFLDINRLDVTDYTKSYFGNYQQRLHYGLETAAYLLLMAASKTNKPLNELSVLEFGAGTGIICLLAKKSGFGKVIYNDLFADSAKDSAVIAMHLGLSADAYVEGDVSQMIAYFQQAKMQPDIVLSRNVIEHIYSLQDYLAELKAIFHDETVLLCATTANPHNPAVRLYTQSIHRKVEYKGFQSRWGKKTDQLEAFLEVRKKIIKENFPELNEQDINALAIKSRGLKKEDILNHVQHYIINGSFTYRPSHSTNTCNPENGNWAERLLSKTDYLEMMKNNGLSIIVHNGFYDTHYRSGILNAVTGLINVLISIAGGAGIYLAPFIVLEGRKMK